MYLVKNHNGTLLGEFATKAAADAEAAAYRKETGAKRYEANSADRYYGCEFDETYNPSTNWAQGGPIIERERILIQPEICSNAWNAISMQGTEDYGPTPLIAAMRCYVASKLGDEIEVPSEL